VLTPFAARKSGSGFLSPSDHKINKKWVSKAPARNNSNMSSVARTPSHVSHKELVEQIDKSMTALKESTHRRSGSMNVGSNSTMHK